MSFLINPWKFHMLFLWFLWYSWKFHILNPWGGVSPGVLSQELTADLLEVKIITILLYENNNCPMLFCTFTIDNSSFLTTVRKKMSCVSLFSEQKFLIYKFKLLSLLERLYSMSSTTYINDLLPVTMMSQHDTNLT